jgi:hypothetical protein
MKAKKHSEQDNGYTFHVVEQEYTAEEREKESIAQVKGLLRIINSNGNTHTSLKEVGV